MRHRLLVSVASIVLASSPVAPAQAGTDGTCVGIGTMVTSYPIVNRAVAPMTPVTTPWTLSLSTGACAGTDLSAWGFAATGVFTGWCDHFSGYGVTNEGNQFAFIGVGPRFVFTGGVVGEAPFIPDVVFGSSCVSGATRFLVGLSGVVLWDCKAHESSGTIGPNAFTDIPLHYRVCA